MIYVGIDVSKDKHDCYIVNSDGEIIRKSSPLQTTPRVSDGCILQFVPQPPICAK